MASSKTDIWNLALSHIGDGDDVDQEDEQSVEGEQCRKFYPIARDMLLERHNWDFAIKTAQLAALEQDASRQWEYRYALPADYVKAITLAPDLNMLTATWLTENQYRRQIELWAKRFEIESDSNGAASVLTNECEAYLKYVYRNENTASYSAGFVMALSYLLASFLAGGPIVKSAKMSLNMLKAYELVLGQATVNISNASSNQPPHMPAHLRGR